MTRDGACPRGNQRAFATELGRQLVEAELGEAIGDSRTSYGAMFAPSPQGRTAMRAAVEAYELAGPAAIHVLSLL